MLICHTQIIYVMEQLIKKCESLQVRMSDIYRVISVSILLLLCINPMTLYGQITKDKVLLIAVGDTEDRLHKELPESFKVEIGEECQKSIANIEKVATSIPGLRTTVERFIGKNFSRNKLESYLQNEKFSKESDSAAVIIFYLITHGEADTDLSEELPIAHFPDGSYRTVNLRNSLRDDANNRLTILLVEACNHEPVSPNGELTLKSGNGLTPAGEELLTTLFKRKSGYIEMVSAAKSYKSYVTEKGGLLAYYFREFLLNGEREPSWDNFGKYLTNSIYKHKIKSDSLRTLRGNLVRVENFRPHINFQYLNE